MNRRKFLLTSLAIVPVASSFVSALAGCGDNPLTAKKPTPPQNVKATATLVSITIRWAWESEVSSGLDSESSIKFRIYRSAIPSAPFEKIGEVSGNVKMYEDLSVTKGETLYYKVSVVLDDGTESELSSESNRALLSILIPKLDLPESGKAIYLNYNGQLAQETDIRSDLTLSKGATEFFALSRFCTHAGCSNMRFNSGIWTCACHGSQFDQTGKVVGSPAQNNLDRYNTAIQENGDLVIELTSTT